jgi:putative hydrolase of the HAD superfamily
MSTVKHLIFDLDDTLLDTTQLLLPIKDTPEFFKRIAEPLPLMPGALENLKYLKNRYKLHLLTQGNPQLQEIKIRSLNISSFFDSIWIADPKKNQGKKEYFASFCEAHSALAKEVMSIGNRKSTDIGPAKEMGFYTCWFAYGEHSSEEISNPNEKPDFIILNHFEMIKTCRL